MNMKWIVVLILYINKIKNRTKKIYYVFYNKSFLVYKGAKLGKEVHFNGRMRIDLFGNAKLVVGDNFISNSGLGHHILANEFSSIEIHNNAIIKIGNNSGISCTSICCKKLIEIGDYVNIGAGCFITDTNFHSSNWRMRSDRKDDIDRCPESIIIEDYVFIGARSIILKGVHIGARSMVSAGSVVVKDIPADELWGGNPAKFIKEIKF